MHTIVSYRTRSTFSKLLLVFAGVSKFVKTNIDPAVKINGTFCCDVLLTWQLLQVMRKISGELFIFQQNSAPAPAHPACKTISLVETIDTF